MASRVCCFKNTPFQAGLCVGALGQSVGRGVFMSTPMRFSCTFFSAIFSPTGLLADDSMSIDDGLFKMLGWSLLSSIHSCLGHVYMQSLHHAPSQIVQKKLSFKDSRPQQKFYYMDIMVSKGRFDFRMFNSCRSFNLWDHGQHQGLEVCRTFKLANDFAMVAAASNNNARWTLELPLMCSQHVNGKCQCRWDNMWHILTSFSSQALRPVILKMSILVWNLRTFPHSQI